jgi:hypothetical protein
MTLLWSFISCFYSLVTYGTAGAGKLNQFSSLPKNLMTRFGSAEKVGKGEKILFYPNANPFTSLEFLI